MDVIERYKLYVSHYTQKPWNTHIPIQHQLGLAIRTPARRAAATSFMPDVAINSNVFRFHEPIYDYPACHNYRTAYWAVVRKYTVSSDINLRYTLSLFKFDKV